jgi:uncharacterized Ntn-hydrolase superfamily protein
MKPSLRIDLARRALALALGALLLAGPALATWSIVVVNTKTREVCVASATCLSDFDLELFLPVMRVGQGAGAAQSLVDFGAVNRKKIWEGLIYNTPPAGILARLKGDPSFQARQYGIVDMEHDPVTFTGTGAGAGKHGVAAIAGDLRYAIQGNVLTGPEVVLAAELALLNTPGDLGQKVLAAMQAARELGGDGRCSCNSAAPTSCGVPPPNFVKSAHVGFIVLSRIGDSDGECSSLLGCTNGYYYLNLNVIGGVTSPDPVRQLQQKYDAWREALSGVPDHILSEVTPGAQSLVADGKSSTDVTIALVDVDGVPLAQGGNLILVHNASGAAAVTQAGPVVDHGNGTYTFTLTAGTQPGEDTYVLHASKALSGFTRLYPDLVMRVDPLADLHCGFDQVSAAAGADVPFVLNLGSALAGKPYLLLGTSAGTSPGVLFHGVPVPLNSSRFLRFTVQSAGLGPLQGSVGVLDPSGRAEAHFAASPALLLPFVGGRLDWSAITKDSPLPAVTSAAGFDVLP